MNKVTKIENKKIYKCIKCGLEAGLEDPNANILCFTKTSEATIAEIQDSERIVRKAKEEDEELKKMHDLTGEGNAASFQPVREADTATEQQINERMDICNSCEYYKDESCMLCGCRVVRNSVYQNKLADKKASCPDGRWKAIED